jgi:hypothetical protein
MAERRMFAKTIIDSDAFLEMPITAQLLYFHLSMRGDDDGFINKPRAIMRLCGAKDDDLKILFAKKFVIPFDSGVVVIKHWKIHNYIRKDTYTETKYKEEKALLELDENSSYRLLCEPLLRTRDESVTSPSTQDRLGKDSIGKDIKREKIKREKAELSSPPSLEEVKEYGRSIGREDLADKFFKYYTATEWNDAKGKVINNWKAKYVSWSNREPITEQTRYGNFEAKEAFEMALKRSYGDD